MRSFYEMDQTIHPQRLDAAPLPSRRVWSGDGPVKLSVLMPAYNEERTIAAVIRALLDVSYPCEFELIVVDDGSTDRTAELLLELADEHADHRFTVHRHPRNFGKGAALLTGAALATGTHMVPFDADHEYSPADIPRLLEPILRGRCEVVYGPRLFGLNTVYQSYRYAMGNKVTTLLANVLFDSYVTDLHTCLKIIPAKLFRRLCLDEAGFGLDTEVTANLLRLGIRPFEVPVSYHSRSHAEGKKLTWRDGVRCLMILGRVRFSEPRRVRTGSGGGSERGAITPAGIGAAGIEAAGIGAAGIGAGEPYAVEEVA